MPTSDLERQLERWLEPHVAKHPLLRDALADVTAVMELKIIDDDARPFRVRIARGKAEVSRGSASKPSFVVEAKARDWKALLAGDLDASAALVDGRLRISGDVGLAVRVAQLLFDD